MSVGIPWMWQPKMSPSHNHMSPEQAKYLSLSLSHSFSSTHPSRTTESVSWMNQGIWQMNAEKLRCKFLSPYLLPVWSSWARDLIHLNLSFLLCTVGWMTSMYQGCGKPLRSHICKSAMAVILMCILNPASPPWMSLQRPREWTEYSHSPRVWKEGELEFHSS